MTALVQNRPRFSEASAVRLAKELFGVEASVHELTSERDQNFLLRASSGQEFVLKIASAADSIDVLDFQNKAMEHIRRQEPLVLCPLPCATLTGNKIAHTTGPEGLNHCVRMLRYLPGVFLADYRPHSPPLLRALGMFFGKMDKALLDLSHPSARRELNWDIRIAGSVIRAGLAHIGDSEQRSLAEHFLNLFEKEAAPLLPGLRASVIHNDGNDHNILVQSSGPDAGNLVAGVIDFGDMLHSITAAEPAIVAAYALLDKANPLAAAAEVIRGYHESFPLSEEELRILFPLICTRLATSVAISAIQQKAEPDKPYLSISEKQAWEALKKLSAVSPELAYYSFRRACGLPSCPSSRQVTAWLKENPDRIGPVVEPRLIPGEAVVLDLSIGSLELPNPADLADTGKLTGLIFGRMKKAGAVVGIGRYNEARALYTGEPFRTPGDEIDEWRTVHLGIDLFQEPGAPVFAPIEGTVHSFQNNAQPFDYGPTIILEHDMGEKPGSFFTLYGHLSLDSLDGLAVGMRVKKGRRIGSIGDFPVNGDWPPHLHFQVICDMLGRTGEFPGVAAPSCREVWLDLCPDPNLVLGIPDVCFPPAREGTERIISAREKHLGRSLSVSYKKPLEIVRGSMQYLYDSEGRIYLDAVNNVPHVGHSHPRVVRAAQEQMAVLNTNTRYLHENIVHYAERLCATLPDSLRVCFFVNSGSEANDLALRLARTHTGRKDIVVVDGAYHGNLTTLIEISPYKFDGPGGSGAPPYVHKIPTPDVYRGPWKAAHPEAGASYALCIRDAIGRARGRIAAFICESVLSCAGQIILPPGYLREVYAQVRSAGGICIADEVQVGLGRVGSHFWAFETQGVVPDIVTAGKPIGNGHPLAAVITTPEIANSFANGMEYFNTFGGNPVSCAVGLAVLDVLKEESLQERALQVGARLLSGLGELKAKHALVGDVRGLGLFLGMEFVRNPDTLEPAAAEASYIVERMKEHGILLSTDGPLHNVIKIKPPLVFTETNAALLIDTLAKILCETPLRC